MGTLQYDSKQKQLTQVVDGKIKAYKDPIMQAEAQKLHLQTWFQQFGITGIPIETLVVIAYPSTIIENIHQDPIAYEKIIHTASLHQRIQMIENKYQRAVLNNSTIRKIASIIHQKNDPLRTDVRGKLNIQDHHLVKGVICKKCHFCPMERTYHGWTCPRCNASDSKAHIQDILDYFLLYGDTITNKQC